MGTMESSAPHNSQAPKYACRLCGSTEFLGPVDTYAIYVAKGDRVQYLRTEIADVDNDSLRCRDCGEETQVDVEDYGSIPIS